MKSSAPTMKDVAREAGVALGTVSKVFNGLPVGASYQAKVEAAAKKLGYQVNQYARGLRAGKTYTAALILPAVDHPYFGSLSQQIYTALARRDYRMLLYLTDRNPDREQDCINMVRQNKVDGIIALTYNPLSIDRELPFVSIDRSLGPDIPCVATDNYGGGRIAAEKLLELGCRHLAFLRTGSMQPGETDKRGDGFEMVCRTRDIPCEVFRQNGDGDADAFRAFFRSTRKTGSWRSTASSAPPTCLPSGSGKSWRNPGSGSRRTCRSSVLTGSGSWAQTASTVPPSSSRSKSWRKPAWISCWLRTVPTSLPWSAFPAATPPAAPHRRSSEWQANT